MPIEVEENVNILARFLGLDRRFLISEGGPSWEFTTFTVESFPGGGIVNIYRDPDEDIVSEAWILGDHMPYIDVEDTGLSVIFQYIKDPGLIE